MNPARRPAGIARRLVSALLVLVLGLSSVELLWGDVHAEPPVDTELAASAPGPEAPSSPDSREQDEDCPCLCDCACVNAQRVVAPRAVLVPHFGPTATSPLPRTRSRAPRSVVPEPHFRPPVR